MAACTGAVKARVRTIDLKRFRCKTIGGRTKEQRLQLKERGWNAIILSEY